MSKAFIIDLKALINDSKASVIAAAAQKTSPVESLPKFGKQVSDDIGEPNLHNTVKDIFSSDDCSDFCTSDSSSSYGSSLDLMPIASTRIEDLLRQTFRKKTNWSPEHSTSVSFMNSPLAKERKVGVEKDSSPETISIEKAFQNFLVTDKSHSPQSCESTSPNSGCLSSAAILRLHR